MSALSLPHLMSGNTLPVRKKKKPLIPCLSNGDGDRRKGSNSSVDSNAKYNSLPVRKVLERPPSKFDEVLQKRQRLNRNGSIGNLQFRGIKREFLEKQTSMIAYSMTVGQDCRRECKALNE